MDMHLKGLEGLFVFSFRVYLFSGTLIRRHRIPKPPPHDDQFYTVEDFNVGKEIAFYSRIFKLTGCDEFTHNFLRKLGVKLAQQDSTPGDPYSNYRKAVSKIIHSGTKILIIFLKHVVGT